MGLLTTVCAWCAPEVTLLAQQHVEGASGLAYGICETHQAALVAELVADDFAEMEQRRCPCHDAGTMLMVRTCWCERAC
jgi:hypothetical protein